MNNLKNLINLWSIVIISTLAHFQISTLTFAQNQYNIWYFGAGTDIVGGNFVGPGAGLDFNSGFPVALTNSAMGFTEGCAVQCDTAGNLLFYTMGDTVWDNTHNIMPNGIGLSGAGSFSSKENSISVPIRGSPTKYFLFTNAGNPTGGGEGLFYSIIDMSLNGGLGDVTATKKVSLLPNTNEKLAVVRHCNGENFWVITALYNTNTYYGFLISDSNIIDTVISSVGPVDTYGADHLKASPARDKLATIISTGFDTIVLYDFDNATGVISNPIIIDTTIAGFVWNGLSFSPDGKLFYTAGTEFTPFNIYQFDLTAPNIPASKMWVGASSDTVYIKFIFDMQIGPDGKIYVAIMDIWDSLNILDAIDNPNVRGVGCNYVNAAVDLAGRICWISLPNLITDYLNFVPLTNDTPIAGFFYTDTCLSDSTSFIDTSQGNPNSWTWDFGDGTISYEQSPKHQYSAPGTYQVILIVFQSCYADTFSQYR